MKILCATDLQPRGAAVIERAQWLARKLQGDLTVFHAVAPDEPRGLALEQRVWRADSHLRSRFADAAARPQVRVRVGDPARRIAEMVNETASDLVVLGASTRGPSSRIFGRGVAERVLRDSRRPTLIVRQTSPAAYSRILLALDLSPESASALELSESLALSNEEINFLVHAYRVPYQGMLASAGTRFDRIDTQALAWRQEFETGVRHFLRRHSQDPWRYRVIMAEDRPVPGILSVAERLQPDLLVLGTRANGVVMRTLTGSVGHEVADSATCDVLLVPPRTAPSPLGSAA